MIFNVRIWISALYIYLQGEKVSICGLSQVFSPQITKRVGPQIADRKVSHLQKVRKSNKFFNSVDLQICYLRK